MTSTTSTLVEVMILIFGAPPPGLESIRTGLGPTGSRTLRLGRGPPAGRRSHTGRHRHGRAVTGTVTPAADSDLDSLSQRVTVGDSEAPAAGYY